MSEQNNDQKNDEVKENPLLKPKTPIIEKKSAKDESVQTPVQKEPEQAKPSVQTAPKQQEAAKPVEQKQEVTAKETVKVEDKQPKQTITDFDSYLENIRQNGSPDLKSALNVLETYAARMKPKTAMTNEQGAQIQHAFWKALLQLVRHTDPAQFKKVWGLVLNYVLEKGEDSAFGDRYVYRFAEYWQYNENELTAFQRILNLIKLTANPETRTKRLKEVDLVRSLELVFTEEDRQRIVQFYKA